MKDPKRLVGKFFGTKRDLDEVIGRRVPVTRDHEYAIDFHHE